MDRLIRSPPGLTGSPLGLCNLWRGIPIPLPGFTIVSRSAFAKAPARQETAEMSPYPFRHIVPVPFPRLSTIGREGLAPYRTVFVSRIPPVHYDYVFSFE